MNSTVLAFDMGLKRTGVATGNTLSKSSTPLTSIAMDKGRVDTKKLDQILTEWQPSLILIGSASDTDTQLKKARNRLRQHIQEQYKVSVIIVDETLSTDAANSMMFEHGVKPSKKTELRDQYAAQIILQSYINTLP